MDMLFATIPVFGEQRRLYWKVKLAYTVSSQNQHGNHTVYVIDIDFGSTVFYDEGLAENEDKESDLAEVSEQKGVWKLYFDGSHAKGKFGAGIYII